MLALLLTLIVASAALAAIAGLAARGFRDHDHEFEPEVSVRVGARVEVRVHNPGETVALLALRAQRVPRLAALLFEPHARRTHARRRLSLSGCTLGSVPPGEDASFELPLPSPSVGAVRVRVAVCDDDGPARLRVHTVTVPLRRARFSARRRVPARALRVRESRGDGFAA
jgi:hypothetical protein